MGDRTKRVHKVSYITPKGVPIVYTYENYQYQHGSTPKCTNCKSKLRYMYYRKERVDKHLGYVCVFCNIIFPYDKYSKVVLIKNNEEGG